MIIQKQLKIPKEWQSQFGALVPRRPPSLLILLSHRGGQGWETDAVSA